MSRRLATVVELAVALAGLAYVLVASVQTPDHPAVTAAELAADVVLSFAGFLLLLALYVAAQLGLPRLRLWLQRRTVRRAIRRLARDRARRMQRRHAARIGGAR